MRVRVLRASLVVLAMAPILLPGPARAQQPGAINFVELFQTLDANDDRMITRDEVPESARAAYDRLAKWADTNHDGKIDQPEYRDLLNRARDSALSAIPRSAESFRAADKDGDGRLRREEFTGLPGMFARIDADGDGFLTLEETTRFRPTADGGLPGANSFGPRFQAMDKNGDRKLSREEFTGVPANFDRIDADKDGSLTPSEIRQFFQANPQVAKKAQETQTKKSVADPK